MKILSEIKRPSASEHSEQAVKKETAGPVKQKVMIIFDKELYRDIKVRAAQLNKTVTAYLSDLAQDEIDGKR